MTTATLYWLTVAAWLVLAVAVWLYPL